MSGPQTIAKVEMNGLSCHIYRRGEGGPLAISIQVPEQRAYASFDMPPALMTIVGQAMVQAGHDNRDSLR